MSTYTKTTNFTAKDNLTSGDPAKVIKGSEFDTEFNAIETAVNSKSDKNNGVHTGTTQISTADIDTLQIDSVSVTATAAEINTLDGITSTTAELNKLDGYTGDVTDLNKLASVTATATEINVLDGSTASTADLNKLAGVTATSTELNLLDGVTATTAELNILDGVTSTTAEINKLDGFTGTVDDLNYAKDLRATGVTSTEFDKLDGLTATTSELNILDGATVTTSELNILDGVTATASELNITDGLTATTAELNVLDGITATTTELNYTDGVTSNIQTQLNTKADLSGANFTGNVDVTGTVTADGLTVDGDDVLGGSGLFVKTSAGSVGVAYTANDVTIANGETETNAGFINSDNSFVIRLDNNNNGVGDFYVTEGASGKAIIKADNNGDVSFYEDTGTTAKLTWDSSDESLGFGDNVKATFGAGNDLQIYHDGSNSYITDAGTGSLRITAQDFRVRNSANNASMITSIDGGSTYLYDNGSQKLATTATGVDVTGTVTADGLELGANDKVQFGTSDSTGLYRTNSGSDLTLQHWGNVSVLIDSDNNDSDTRAFVIGANSQDTSTAENIAKFSENGDFHLYEDTGTTAKFVWDSSAETLAIGATSTRGVGEKLYLKDGGLVIDGVNTSVNTTALSIGFDATINEASFVAGATSGASTHMTFTTTSGGVEGERMRIDSSGNVGIGTASPSAPVHVQKNQDSESPTVYISNESTGTSAASVLQLDANGNNFFIKNYGDGTSNANQTHFWSTAGGSQFIFGTNGSERARIDSSGNLLVGKTSASSGVAGAQLQSNGQLFTVVSGGYGVGINRLDSDGELIQLRKGGTTVGSWMSRSSLVSTIILDPRGGGSGHGLTATTNGFYPTDETGTGKDGGTDLGTASSRFRDLYLSGGVYLGGTGSANKLDDYETGTFSLDPSINGLRGTTTNPTYTLSRDVNQYIKIGDYVTVYFDTWLSGLSSEGAGSLYLVLPFTAASVGAGGEYYGTIGYSVGFDVEPYSCLIDNGSGRLYLMERNGSILNTSALSSTTRFRFSATYRAA